MGFIRVLFRTIIPAQLLAHKTPPADADVQAFYKKNRTRYIVPERRVIRYALIGPEQLKSAVVPTEAEIQKFHAANQASYGAVEKRKLSQIVLPDQASAREQIGKAECRERECQYG